VCYSEHEVVRDEESSSCSQLSFDSAEVKHSHAVVGEGPHRLLVEDNEILVPKVLLFDKGLPFHFIYRNKYKSTQFQL
jgi:hypothetical protein